MEMFRRHESKACDNLLSMLRFSENSKSEGIELYRDRDTSRRI